MSTVPHGEPCQAGPVRYELLRSSRRTAALEITSDGRVLVRAPRRTSRAWLDSFVLGHAGWIETHLERQRRRQEARPEPTEAQREALICRAREVLPARTAHFAALLGLTPAAVTITGARKRFGSCSASNRICYSWRLMQYPEAAVDYVVVHELAHIVHKDHSRNFYAYVERFLPDWRERRALLKE